MSDAYVVPILSHPFYCEIDVSDVFSTFRVVIRMCVIIALQQQSLCDGVSRRPHVGTPTECRLGGFVRRFALKGCYYANSCAYSEKAVNLCEKCYRNDIFAWTNRKISSLRRPSFCAPPRNCGARMLDLSLFSPAIFRNNKRWRREHVRIFLSRFSGDTHLRKFHLYPR